MKLKSLRRGSKKWWRLSNELLGKSNKSTSFPPMKYDDGSWALDAKSKADGFANFFKSK